LPSASLGQYASLSFVVIGRGKQTDGSRQQKFIRELENELKRSVVLRLPFTFY